MATRNCGNCLFSRLDAANVLECRHTAPVGAAITPTGIIATAWPRVLRDDWCGEWQRFEHDEDDD